MKIKFKINKRYLITHTINVYHQNKLSPFPEWEKLENRLWQKYKNEPAYYFLNLKHIQWAINQILSKNKKLKNKFAETASKLEKIYKEILVSKEFSRLHRETADYLLFIKKNWKKNKKFILQYLQNELGLKIPKYTITVLITHPKLHNGTVLSKKERIIAWGHPEDWLNYSTVYITHEILHILIAEQYKYSEIMHAIIELAVNNELRIRLNKKGYYFTENKKMIGHRHLREFENKILPYWRLYLKKSPPKNIGAFEREIKRRLL